MHLSHECFASIFPQNLSFEMKMTVLKYGLLGIVFYELLSGEAVF